MPRNIRKPGLMTRLRALVPKRSVRPPATPLALTPEEIAGIRRARFLSQVETDGAPVALWQTVTAAREEIRQQVRRATLILAAIQCCLLAMGVYLLLSR